MTKLSAGTLSRKQLELLRARCRGSFSLRRSASARTTYTYFGICTSIHDRCSSVHSSEIERTLIQYSVVDAWTHKANHTMSPGKMRVALDVWGYLLFVQALRHPFYWHLDRHGDRPPDFKIRTIPVQTSLQALLRFGGMHR
jgi:hypothetical protein